MLKNLIILSMGILFSTAAVAQDAAADLNMSWRQLAGVNGLYFHPEGTEVAKVAAPQQASAPAKNKIRVATQK